MVVQCMDYYSYSLSIESAMSSPPGLWCWSWVFLGWFRLVADFLGCFGVQAGLGLSRLVFDFVSGVGVLAGLGIVFWSLFQGFLDQNL